MALFEFVQDLVIGDQVTHNHISDCKLNILQPKVAGQISQLMIYNLSWLTNHVVYTVNRLDRI